MAWPCAQRPLSVWSSSQYKLLSINKRKTRVLHSRVRPWGLKKDLSEILDYVMFDIPVTPDKKVHSKTCDFFSFYLFLGVTKTGGACVWGGCTYYSSHVKSIFQGADLKTKLLRERSFKKA